MKRNIEEIIATYKLEPGLKDVYVEGDDDKKLIEWFLLKQGIRDISIFTIDLIDIPDSLIDKYSDLQLNKGSNRDKLIAFSYELDKEIESELSILCIGDMDYDKCLDKEYSNKFFTYTDYQSSELYSFNRDVLEKFLRFVIKVYPQTAHELIMNMGEILQELFVIRAANELLEWGMVWLDYYKYISIEGDRIVFKENNYVRAYLSKNDRLSDIEKFRSATENVKSKLSSNKKFNIRGHDIACLLLCALRRFRSNYGKGRRKFIAGFNNHVTCEGALRACIEVEQLESENLFRKITSL